ncbi:SIR2 family protein [Laribacter hongkongensis]|uniref:SIR2 family protein n=1 Tax=Laribacter hongkongensis TaxID=168471 RepID=UPI001EFECEB4|nr:SIR2 family protein [Laribacter hongkongensis]MCG9107189.1 SIR2 family protein [Laribacter hongkongensis]
MMIRDFKAQIFCRENNLSKREIDTGDPVWVERIDAFFRGTSLLPPDGDPTEYAKAFEAVYPQPRLRRQYIDDAIKKGTPCYGHKVLASLMAARKVDCVFTTNFDHLVEDAAAAANALLPVAEQCRPTTAAIDSADRAKRCLTESDWPLVAKLHGDYQSVEIKNTDSELEKQDVRMRHVLVEASQRFGMVFVGYSGRDASVMEALNAVLKETTPFPNGLYWVAQSPSKLLPAVVEFLQNALQAGVDVAVVECKTFDELAADLLKHVDLPKVLMDHLVQGRVEPRLVPVQLPQSHARSFPVLRYSALLIESMPRIARRITLNQTTTSPVIRNMLKEQHVRAAVAANGNQLAVFGRDDAILAALAPLGPKLAGTVELNAGRDSWALGLLYDALVQALSRHRPLVPRLRSSGHSLVVASPREGEDEVRAQRRVVDLAGLQKAYDTALTGSVRKLGYPFQEGIFLKLEQIEDRWWCGFEPYTFVHVPRDRAVTTPEADQVTTEEDGLGLPQQRRGGDPAGDWRRERWFNRRNKEWAAIIEGWFQMLTSAQEGGCCAFGIEDGAGIDAVFTLSRFTGWSRPGHHHNYFDRIS